MHYSSLLILALIGTLVIGDEVSNNIENVRVKRVTVEDVEFANEEAPPKPKSKFSNNRNLGSRAAAVEGAAAIVIPPYHDGTPFDKLKSSCLLYLEGITIIAISKKTIGGVQQAYTLPLIAANDSYGYADGYADCKPNTTTFGFKIEYNVKEDRQLLASDKTVLMTIPKSTFTLDLLFTYNTGFDLTKATISGLQIQKNQGTVLAADAKIDGDANNLNSTSIRAYYGHNYACSGTPAIFFPQVETDKNLLAGIILNNFQVQGAGIDRDDEKSMPYFGSRTTDCIPTFSQGTWMGIVVTLILVSVLAFAFLMLNSVQTMDRFDDPKQKQITINFKE